MKRKELIRLFLANGWRQACDCGRHTIFTNGESSEPIPWHAEINEDLAKKIIKRRGLK
ncbi:MAG: toxin-antitoxin system, toxin component, HicA family protein [Dehalococcoidia bacterium]|nr:toxin-antitoxin system, toxin component, HicA family protein [Dehalococcoidia bacterium]